METRQTKEQFIKTVKREISDREKLLNFYKTRYLSTLKDFDGFTFDFHRLREAVTRQMSDHLMYFWNDNIHNPSKPLLQLRKKLSQFSGCEQRMNVPIALKNGKIDYKATLQLSWDEIYAKQRIDELRDIVDNYDALMEVADNFKKAADDFGKLPRRFRETLQKIYIPQVDC